MTLTMVNFPSTPSRDTTVPEPNNGWTPERPFGPHVLVTPPAQINWALGPLGRPPTRPSTGPPSLAQRQRRVGVRPGIGQGPRPAACRRLKFG